MSAPCLPVSYFSPAPPGKPNFGDALNAKLLPLLTGRPVQHVPFGAPLPSYLVIGSTLQLATTYSRIWGAGFISNSESLELSSLQVDALRGPLSRSMLHAKGIYCPAVFGDPAILLPLLYAPPVAKTWDLAVIPHYVDQGHPAVAKMSRLPGVCVVDVLGPWRRVIRQICSSRYVFSSSLHGLIVADAYGVPNLRFVATDRIIGGDFKFDDYRQGVGGRSFIRVPVEDIADSPRSWFGACYFSPTLDAALELIRSCPFL